MFENYKLGVHSSSVKYESGIDYTSDLSISTEDYLKKDKYGNIVGMCWASSARFTLVLASDSWIPVADGAIILTESEQTPAEMIPENSTYAYNTSDYKCWKYENDTWIEQPDIIEFKNSDNIVLFSKKDCITTVDIKNFRGDSVFTAEGNNFVSIRIDSELSGKLGQGFYSVDICRTVNNDTVLIRRIPLSIVSNSTDAVFGNLGEQCPTHKTVNINKSCNVTNVTIGQQGTGELAPATLEE